MVATTTFPSLRLSRYKQGEDACLKVYPFNGGKCVRFRASAKAYDSDLKVSFWKSFSFVAYGEVAEKLLKMKIQIGSSISLSAEPQYRVPKEDATSSTQFKVLNVDYVHGTHGTKEMEQSC